MAHAPGRVPYPWGTVPPRQRLAVVSAKVHKALEEARTGGFRDIAGHVAASVRASRALVDAMDHLAQAGLRSTDARMQPVSPDRVHDALRKVRHAVSELAASSALTLSERYQGFCDAVGGLAELAAECERCGVVRPAQDRTSGGWDVFGP